MTYDIKDRTYQHRLPTPFPGKLGRLPGEPPQLILRLLSQMFAHRQSDDVHQNSLYSHFVAYFCTIVKKNSSRNNISFTECKDKKKGSYHGQIDNHDLH